MHTNEIKDVHAEGQPVLAPKRRQYKQRAPRAEFQAELDIVLAFAEEQQPVTIRQVFYHLVSKGLIEKTENAYHNLNRRLTKRREEERLPYDWFEDSSRRVIRPTLFNNPVHALNSVISWYRRNRWLDQDDYVEVWLEKNALAGVVESVTDDLGVVLRPTRGYSSVTYLSEAAKQLKAKAAAGKAVHIYYFGDHDPSGVHIPVEIERSLKQHGCEFTLTRTAVNLGQIESMNLPTRPTKGSDSRSNKFVDAVGNLLPSVDLDALPPDTLRSMVRECVEQHIDRDAWEAAKDEEIDDTETLSKLRARIEKDGIDWLRKALKRRA
jgi:hypothetical protein